MTFSSSDLKFIDSLQFMADSLENLADSLKTTGPDPYQKFNNMKTRFDKDEFKLICKKGFYPYEFIDSYEKIYHPTLPPIEAFYSKIKMEGLYNKALIKLNNCLCPKDKVAPLSIT